MRFSTVAVAAAAAGSATAQSNTTSVCDKYTTALLMNNTAANQFTVVSLLVKTAVIGNFTGNGSMNANLPGSLNAVPGILSAAGGLMKYFDGSLQSTNRNNMPVSVNFLDGQTNASDLITMPMSIGSTGSNQYTLFSHLVEYFGFLLGCSGYGMDGFPAYTGSNSQYNVHKYMDLSETEHSYFISQVGLAATSFGVTMDDVNTVAMSLNSTFGSRCAMPVMVIPGSQAQNQVICQGASCPLASPAASGCSGMAAVAGVTPTSPAVAAATGSTTGSATAMTTGTGAAVSATGAAASSASTTAGANAAPRQTVAAGLMAGVAAVGALML